MQTYDHKFATLSFCPFELPLRSFGSVHRQIPTKIKRYSLMLISLVAQHVFNKFTVFKRSFEMDHSCIKFHLATFGDLLALTEAFCTKVFDELPRDPIHGRVIFFYISKIGYRIS